MKINELKDFLEKEGLTKIYFNGSKKFYVFGDFIYDNGQWKNIPDVFGIYKDNNTDEYYFFITDSERGLRCYAKRTSSEDEACEYLIDMARRVSYAGSRNKGT